MNTPLPPQRNRTPQTPAIGSSRLADRRNFGARESRAPRALWKFHNCPPLSLSCAGYKTCMKQRPLPTLFFSTPHITPHHPSQKSMTISIRRNKRDLSQSQVSREMLGVQFEPELSLKLGSSQDTAPRDEITKKQMTIFFNGEMRVLDVTETQVHFFSPLFFLSGQLDTPIVANAFESLIFAERYKLLECCWFVAYPYYKPKRHNCRKKKGS